MHVATLNEIVTYVHNWNFHKGRLSGQNRDRLPVQWLDTETFEEIPLEVGITALFQDGREESRITFCKAGTFS